FLLVVSIFITSVRSVDIYTKHRSTLGEIFGENVRVSTVKAIIIDEAWALGISAEQHLHHCFINGSNQLSKRKLEIDEALKEFKVEYRNLCFRTADGVMEKLRDRTPKTHAVIVALYEEAITPLRRESARFIRILKHTLIRTLFDYSKSKNNAQQVHVIAKGIRKVFNEYDGLSSRGKRDLEKHTCFRTTTRILNQTGDMMGTVAQIRLHIRQILAVANEES
ncbi:hypothetical protein PENTCL1PPCAC_3871, partial [Pristionchus entomophagus]